MGEVTGVKEVKEVNGVNGGERHQKGCKIVIRSLCVLPDIYENTFIKASITAGSSICDTTKRRLPKSLKDAPKW